MNIFFRRFCAALVALFAIQAQAQQAEALPRIVALSPHSVEMLYAIGAGEQIIATVDYADYPEAAQAIRRIGRYDHIDMEALMLLQPDLVVLSTKDTAPDLVARLEALAMPLVETSVDSVDQVADRLASLGALTGHAAQGQQVAERFRAELKALRSQYVGQSKVSVFFQVWPEPLTTSSSPWLNAILSDCSGENVFADAVADYPQVSMEQVLIRQPQVIFKPVFHGASNQELVPWQQWPELPAVANDLVVTLDGDRINRTGPRVLEGMAQICAVLDRARHHYHGGAPRS